VSRRHPSGAGLEAGPAVHPISGGYAVVLGVARCRWLTHVSQPHCLWLERLSHDLWRGRPSRGAALRTRGGGSQMNKLLLIAGGSSLVYGVLAVLMGVLPGIE